MNQDHHSPARDHSSPHDRKDIEERVLQIIARLAAELHPSRASESVKLDSSIQDDIGIDSLGRAELAARIGSAFGVRLPDDLIATARTPSDLVRFILQNTGFAHPLTGSPDKDVISRPLRIPRYPDHVETLSDLLDWRAEKSTAQTYLDFIDPGGQTHSLTFDELHNRSRKVAAGLQDLGVAPSDPVAIMLPTGLEFFYSFFGIMLAGAIAVPLYPPDRPEGAADFVARQTGILSNCQSRHLITFSEATKMTHLLRTALPQSMRITTVGELLDHEPSFQRVSTPGDHTAFLQYTSGSTGAPKGVTLSHLNLLSNIRAMGKAISATSSDVFVSWLPLYHDMGLIGACLGTLYYGAFLALTSPLSFIAYPSRWLWLIHRYRGTLSAAPNFAYEICASKIPDDQFAGLDLSSWRLALNGAEPVSAATLHRFTNRFAKSRFRPQAMFPVYGLAESSVGLTFPPLGRAPRIQNINRTQASRGKVVPDSTGDGSETLPLVSCGIPLPGHRVRIVNDRDSVVPEQVIGHIQFQGPSSTSGYYNNPKATDTLFHYSGDPSYRGVWLDSGDLGYLSDGELFITGRAKDLIIRGGQHFFPQEIEEKVSEVPGIRKGCVAVFGTSDPSTGTERIIVAAETRIQDEKGKQHLRKLVETTVNPLLGTPADEILLLAPRSIPKTPSGKLRRSDCRQLYETRQLGKATTLPWLRAGAYAIRLRVLRLFKTGLRVLRGISIWLLFLLALPIAVAGLALIPSIKDRQRFVRFLAQWLLMLSGIRLQTSGMDRLPEPGQRAVLVANHSSYLDAIVLSAALPITFHFVAKKELASHIFLGPLFRRLGCRFVERFETRNAIEDTRQLSSAVARGEVLLFFPEGTFSVEAGVKPFKIGAFQIAAEAQVPIIPLAIRGTRSVLPGGYWLPRPRPVEIQLADPIVPQGVRWSDTLQLRDQARQAIQSRSREPEVPR